MWLKLIYFSQVHSKSILLFPRYMYEIGALWLERPQKVPHMLPQLLTTGCARGKGALQGLLHALGHGVGFKISELKKTYQYFREKGTYKKTRGSSCMIRPLYLSCCYTE